MAAKGFRERVLIPALREQGLSVRNARPAIDAVFNFIKDALGRHERVELPIGTFTVRPRTGQKRARKFGKIVTMPDYKIDFQPCAKLNLAAAGAPPPPPRPTRTKRKQVPVKSDLTTSTELIVDFIRGNVETGNWAIFFNELKTGPSVPAMFKQAWPQNNELHPLEQADQVIAATAPEEIPEDSWKHLYACISWFAWWTQRVMPKALWLEAMKCAKKTLLPDAQR